MGKIPIGEEELVIIIKRWASYRGSPEFAFIVPYNCSSLEVRPPENPTENPITFAEFKRIYPIRYGVRHRGKLVKLASNPKDRHKLR
jgi:hypothetical protein